MISYVSTISTRRGERRHPDGFIYRAYTYTVHTSTCPKRPKRSSILHSGWRLSELLKDEPKWLAQKGPVQYLPCPKCIANRDGMLALFAAARQERDRLEVERDREAEESRHQRRQVGALNDASTFQRSLEEGSRNAANVRLREMYPLTYARLLHEERLRRRIALWLNQFGYCTTYRPVETGLGTYCTYCKGTEADHRISLGGAA